MMVKSSFYAGKRMLNQFYNTRICLLSKCVLETSSSCYTDRLIFVFYLCIEQKHLKISKTSLFI